MTIEPLARAEIEAYRARVTVGDVGRADADKWHHRMLATLDRLMKDVDDAEDAVGAFVNQQDRMVIAGGADAPMSQELITSFAHSNLAIYENAKKVMDALESHRVSAPDPESGADGSDD